MSGTIHVAIISCTYLEVHPDHSVICKAWQINVYSGTSSIPDTLGTNTVHVSWLQGCLHFRGEFYYKAQFGTFLNVSVYNTGVSSFQGVLDRGVSL